MDSVRRTLSAISRGQDGTGPAVPICEVRAARHLLPSSKCEAVHRGFLDEKEYDMLAEAKMAFGKSKKIALMVDRGATAYKTLWKLHREISLKVNGKKEEGQKEIFHHWIEYRFGKMRECMPPFFVRSGGRRVIQALTYGFWPLTGAPELTMSSNGNMFKWGTLEAKVRCLEWFAHYGIYIITERREGLSSLSNEDRKTILQEEYGEMIISKKRQEQTDTSDAAMNAGKKRHSKSDIVRENFDDGKTDAVFCEEDFSKEQESTAYYSDAQNKRSEDGPQKSKRPRWASGSLSKANEAAANNAASSSAGSSSAAASSALASSAAARCAVASSAAASYITSGSDGQNADAKGEENVEFEHSEKRASRKLHLEERLFFNFSPPIGDLFDDFLQLANLSSASRSAYKNEINNFVDIGVVQEVTQILWVDETEKALQQRESESSALQAYLHFLELRRQGNDMKFARSKSSSEKSRRLQGVHGWSG